MLAEHFPLCDASQGHRAPLDKLILLPSSTLCDSPVAAPFYPEATSFTPSELAFEGRRVNCPNESSKTGEHPVVEGTCVGIFVEESLAS